MARTTNRPQTSKASKSSKTESRDRSRHRNQLVASSIYRSATTCDKRRNEPCTKITQPKYSEAKDAYSSRKPMQDAKSTTRTREKPYNIARDVPNTRRQEPHHPLGLALNDATSRYRSSFVNHADTLLTDKHRHLLERLTSPTDSHAADAGVAASVQDRINSQRTRAAELARPLRDERVVMLRDLTTTSSPLQAAAGELGSKQKIEMTLDHSFQALTSSAGNAKEILIALTKEHRSLCVEIDALAREILSEKEVDASGSGEEAKQELMRELQRAIDAIKEESLSGMQEEEKVLHAKDQQARKAMMDCLTTYFEEN